MAGFNDNPILNSPYHEPTRHWALDDDGKPVKGEAPKEGRRESKYIIPVAQIDQKQRGGQRQSAPRVAQDAFSLTATAKEGEWTLINAIRKELKAWKEKDAFKRGVTATTEDLLKYWRGKEVEPSLFFCQLEAVETLIWLNEVAPNTEPGKKILQDIRKGNATSGSSLFRIACKMATGSGKTTVMALLIAYHACNADRHPKKPYFVRHFLVITPGITVRDRLRVLLPSHAENYYEAHQFLPPGWMDHMKQAKVVITHYHKFIRRKKPIPPGARAIIPEREEGERAMLARVWDSDLPKEKVLVINDEAHHCYRNRELSKEEQKKINKEGRDSKVEVKQNNEAARLWINGIESLEKQTGLHCVYDLSATPSFLRGSGWREDTIFPWVASDFSLMDAIESGIVKIPRLPVRDNTKAEIPYHRDVYNRVRNELPGGASKANKERQDLEGLPEALGPSLHTLYEHYAETALAWEKVDDSIPPVFIIVCNNTTTSDLIYRHIAGYWDEERELWMPGDVHLKLFNNIDKDTDKPYPQPRTILVDSYQMESGGPVSAEFKVLAKALDESNGSGKRTDSNLADMTNEGLLREVLNTVGKPGRLGAQVRCVVSVSMLTEGWDAQNVTHILGVRAFGTQLLCEQVVGRALRRRTYDDFEDESDKTDSEGRKVYRPQYADVFGVPFSFAEGTPVNGPMQNPTSRVHALSKRQNLEVKFPRLSGYRFLMPSERLRADFSKNRKEFTLEINSDEIPISTDSSPIVGPEISLRFTRLEEMQEQEVALHLAGRTAKRYFADEEGRVSPQRKQDLVPIVEQWMKNHVSYSGKVTPGFLCLPGTEDQAAERIHLACVKPHKNNKNLLRPIPREDNPTGTSARVDFMTGKKLLFKTTKSHVNLAVCDSAWEQEMCAEMEESPRVLRYINNDFCNGGLRFSVPYTHALHRHSYYPDFIAVIDDGHGPDNPLHLVIEVKGERDNRDEAKADTMKTLWVPAANNDGRWGRWAFIEMRSPHYFQSELDRLAGGGA